MVDNEAQRHTSQKIVLQLRANVYPMREVMARGRQDECMIDFVVAIIKHQPILSGTVQSLNRQGLKDTKRHIHELQGSKEELDCIPRAAYKT